MEWKNELLGPMSSTELRAELIQMGRLGWEPVSAYATNGWHFAVLRQPEKIGVAHPVPDDRRTRVEE